MGQIGARRRARAQYHGQWRQIRLSGTFDNKGKAGGVGAVATSAIVFAPAGKGTSFQGSGIIIQARPGRWYIDFSRDHEQLLPLPANWAEQRELFARVN